MNGSPKSRARTRSDLSLKEVKRIVWGAVIVAVVATITLLWPSFFSDRPEHVVVVYWTHHCACAEPWIKSLREAGYKVRDFEQYDLQNVRTTLHTPMHGCHLGSYLGYFLEGHVPPSALKALEQRRPEASGLGFLRRSAATEDRLILFSKEGKGRPVDAALFDIAPTSGVPTTHESLSHE